MFSVFQPHYVRESRRVVHKIMRVEDRDKAMQIAGGGDYELIGTKERDCLMSIGLCGLDYLIDVGCGAGRLAFALRDMPSLRYLGTDVVPELVEYSARKCGRRDWRFVLVDGLRIPERDNRADMVAFFSVFTHLSRRECFNYLTEAARVVLPAGRIVVSFLDSSVTQHRLVAGNWASQHLHRLLGNRVKLTLLSENQFKEWGDRLALECRFMGTEAVGQSICVYQKPPAIF